MPRYGYRGSFNQPDTTDLEAGINDAQAIAAAAASLAANARGMVLARDPALNQAAMDAATAVSKYTTLAGLAADYQAALQASVADRQALHTQGDATAAGLSQEIADRKAGDNAEAAARIAADAAEAKARTDADAAEALARKAGDDALGTRVTTLEALTKATFDALTALTTRVGNLEKLQVLVAMGTTNLPASLAAGATTNVVVTLSKSMGTATYSTGYALAGGTSILGLAVVTGVVTQTATTVTVQVKNTGLAALLNLSTASVSVVAAKDVAA